MQMEWFQCESVTGVHIMFCISCLMQTRALGNGLVKPLGKTKAFFYIFYILKQCCTLPEPY